MAVVGAQRRGGTSRASAVRGAERGQPRALSVVLNRASPRELSVVLNRALSVVLKRANTWRCPPC